MPSIRVLLTYNPCMRHLSQISPLSRLHKQPRRLTFVVQKIAEPPLHFSPMSLPSMTLRAPCSRTPARALGLRSPARTRSRRWSKSLPSLSLMQLRLYNNRSTLDLVPRSKLSSSRTFRNYLPMLLPPSHSMQILLFLFYCCRRS